MGSKIAIVYNSNHVIHNSKSSSPENPDRITRIEQNLRNRTDLIGTDADFITNFSPATLIDMLRVHERRYLEFVDNYCKRGGGFLGDSTYLNKNTYKVAAMAAGGAIKAMETVRLGNHKYSYALVRPPGHHAWQDRYGGYCIFNNGAIATRYAQKKLNAKKIMIVDWDGHAADGTMRIFYDDPTVLHISIHRDPHEFYPHEGFMYQIGKGEGRGYNVNVEMPIGSSDNEYLYVFEEIVFPLFNQYKPDVVMGCNGFDAYYKDPFAKLYLTQKGYYDLVSMMRDQFGPEKFMILQEGGYNKDNGVLGSALCHALAGRDMSFSEDVDFLTYSVTREKKARKIVEDNVFQLQETLSDFFKF